MKSNDLKGHLEWGKLRSYNTTCLFLIALVRRRSIGPLPSCSRAWGRKSLRRCTSYCRGMNQIPHKNLTHKSWMVSLLLSKGTECNKVDLEIPHQCATVIAHGRYYGRNIGCYNGRNISAIFPCNGQSANTVFSAETVIFSQNKPVTALFSCNGQSAKTGFWPKK